jgi:hypothetical protein
MCKITRLMLGAACFALTLSPVRAVQAASPDDPLVVELFTSQGCSSCPPADAYLAELKRTRPDLLVLDFHVDYWDRLGWHDPFSLATATARQQFYAGIMHTDLYTPQLVLGGSEQAIGSARMDVQDAIGLAVTDRQAVTPITLSLTALGTQLQVSVGPGKGPATLWLVGYDDRHTTAIGRGENTGLTESEVNIVRSITNIGAWNGQAVSLSVARPTGEHVAVLVQQADGLIRAARALDSPQS